MNLEYFSRHRPGIVFDISWDRGNGELEMDYVLCGFKNNLPLLVHYSAIRDENPAFFDIKNLGRYIEEIRRADLKKVDSGIISKIVRRQSAANWNFKKI
ncbi:hypothetical protein HY449_02600 [Candidatus Pacearchaeota archaeon]|nr:hypothetical protein [Candidatus Pacearchaeota archaeon]